jgi:WD40 repeat protein
MTKFIDWFNQLSEEDQKYRLRHLPETLLEGKNYTKLYKLLSDYEFITTKINHPLFGVQALIEDYDLLQDETLLMEFTGDETISSLKKIQGTLRLSAHIINADSQQLPAQLTGRLLHFHTPEINNFLQQIPTDQGLRCLTPSLTPPGSPLIRTLSGHSDWVNAIAVTPDGKTLISGSDDNTIKIWDLLTGTEKLTFKGHSNSVRAIALTPDGKTVISGSYDKTIQIWDIATGKKKFTFIGHSDSVSAVAITPDGKTLISGSVDNTIKIWDVATREEKFTFQGHSYSVSAVAITPDGKTLISGSVDNTIKIWDVATREEKFTLIGHGDWVSAVAITPDGKTLISGSDDNTIKIWDIATRQEIATFTGESPINCCAVAADGVTIVAGESSGRLHFLRLQGR